MCGGEEEDGDQGNGGPDVAALDDGQDIRPGNVSTSDATRGEHEGRDPLHPVDGALDGRVRTAWHVAGEPLADGFSWLGSIYGMLATVTDLEGRGN